MTDAGLSDENQRKDDNEYIEYSYDPTTAKAATAALDSIRGTLSPQQHTAYNHLDLSTLRLHSIRASYSLDILTQFYNDLMIPHFPISEERDDLEDWICCLDPADQTNDPGPSMDILLLLCDTSDHVNIDNVDNAPESNKGNPHIFILAGTTVEYYKRAQTGLLAYMVVDYSYRQNGIMKQLHSLAIHAIYMLHASNYYRYCNANNNLNAPLSPPPLVRAIFAETNTVDAGDASPDEIRSRHKVLYKLGYRQLLFPYVQPPLKEEEGSFHFEDIMLLVYMGQQEQPHVDANTNYHHNSNINESREEGKTQQFLLNFPNGMIPTDIIYQYVVDFFMSVFGYETYSNDTCAAKRSEGSSNYKFKDDWFYKLVAWYRKQPHYEMTRIKEDLPWKDDIMNLVRKQYEYDLEQACGKKKYIGDKAVEVDEVEVDNHHIVVIGAGAAGLAATVTLAKTWNANVANAKATNNTRPPVLTITLVESHSFVGGRIRTVHTNTVQLGECNRHHHQQHSTDIIERCQPFAPWPVPIGAEFVHGVGSAVNTLIEDNHWATEETFDLGATTSAEECLSNNSFAHRQPQSLNRKLSKLQREMGHIKVFGDGRCWDLHNRDSDRNGNNHEIDSVSRFPLLIKRAKRIWEEVVERGEQFHNTIDNKIDDIDDSDKGGNNHSFPLNLPKDMSLAAFVEQQMTTESEDDVRMVVAIMDSMFAKTAGSRMDAYGVNEASREELEWQYEDKNWRTKGCFTEVISYYIDEIDNINREAEEEKEKSTGLASVRIKVVMDCPIISVDSIPVIRESGSFHSHPIIRLSSTSSTIKEIVCDKAIITVPLAVLKAEKIRFDGDFVLPREKLFAINQINMFSGMKAHILLKKGVDIVVGNNADCDDLLEHTELFFCPGEMFTQVWMRRNEDSVFITGFVVADGRDQLKKRIDDCGKSAEALFLNQLQRMFTTQSSDPSACNVFMNKTGHDPTCSAFVLHDWSEDEHTLGIYSSPSIGAGWQSRDRDGALQEQEQSRAPLLNNSDTESESEFLLKTQTKYSYSEAQTCRHFLAQPIKDSIFFAGEHTNIKTCATVQAALESGVKAAHEVVSALSQTY